MEWSGGWRADGSFALPEKRIFPFRDGIDPDPLFDAEFYRAGKLPPGERLYILSNQKRQDRKNTDPTVDADLSDVVLMMFFILTNRK